jgi:putative hydrolase of the HAD superfamily
VLDCCSYWETVAKDLHRTLAETQMDELIDQLIDADIDLWTQPNQPMIDWAQSLQSGGTATAILSNIGDAMESGILERFPWLRRFTHHTFSHRLRIAKPDQRIYHHAIAAIAVSPQEALFIDDRIENVDAARAFGIHAIQYRSHEAFLRELESCKFSGLRMPVGVSS